MNYQSSFTYNAAYSVEIRLVFSPQYIFFLEFIKLRKLSVSFSIHEDPLRSPKRGALEAIEFSEGSVFGITEISFVI